MSWRVDTTSEFIQVGNYDIYSHKSRQMELAFRHGRLVINNVESEFDQVFLRDRIDVKNISVDMRINKQPVAGTKISLGITDTYTDSEGKKKNIIFQRGNGDFVAVMIWIKFITMNKILVTFRADTKEPNWGGYKYYAQYEADSFQQMVARDGTFEGHTLTFNLHWNGESFIMCVTDPCSKYLKNKEVVSEISCQIPSCGWNGLTPDDFEEEKGFAFLVPGKGSSLELFMGSDRNEDKEIKNLGINDGFWAYTPFPFTSPKFPFEQLPEILQETGTITEDILECRTESVPFSQGINLVRFLGGWNGNGNTLYGKDLGMELVSLYDLAYRKKDGMIGYRFGEDVPDYKNMIRARLDPFVNKGIKDINLVFDNIPYCFPQKEYIGEVYGQSALPADLQEWKEFIENVLLELVRLYGKENLKNWSFRFATEGDDYGRFSGTLQEYCKMYEIVARAVEKIVPEARLGPYNVLNDYDHLAEVVRYAAERNLKLDYIASSVYIEENQDPDLFLEDIEAAVHKIRSLYSSGNELNYEVHEYDWLSMASGYFARIPDVRGVAGNFHTMMNLRKMGADRIYHWGITETVAMERAQYNMVTGQMWLFCVLSTVIGARMYELNLDKCKDSRILQKAVGFFGGEKYKNMIIISSYDLEAQCKGKEKIRICIPSDIICAEPKKSQVYELSLNEQTDWYSQMREDFRREGILAEPWIRLGFVSKPYNSLSTPEAISGNHERWQKIFEQNSGEYMELSKNSLRMKRSSVSVKREEKNLQFEIEVENPSVYIVVW